MSGGTSAGNKDEKKRNERKSSKPDSNDAMHVMSLVSSLAVERDSVLRALRREEETSRRLRKEMRERARPQDLEGGNGLQHRTA